MDLVSRISGSILQACEASLRFLDDGSALADFEGDLMSALMSVGREIHAAALEALDAEVREDRAAREGWIVHRNGDEHTLMGLFGEVRYSRTLFKHKATNKHCHLVDVMSGFTAHQRLTCGMEAKLVELSTKMSFRTAGDAAGEVPVSGQTVMRCVHGASTPSSSQAESPTKRVVDYVYIEADEDHIAAQKGHGHIGKLVLVHEGSRRVGKRRNALVGKRYFGGIYKDSYELWKDVWDYVYATYDMDKVRTVFVSGDGAQWISSGAQMEDGAVFLLDKFHIKQYIKRASGGSRELERELGRAVWNFDWARMDEVIREALEAATTESQAKTVLGCRHYLKSHRAAIENHAKWPGALGCSAEGQVSHVLSARLSTRPMAWSGHGADQMIRLRIATANGHSISSHILDARAKGTTPLAAGNALVARAGKRLRDTLATDSLDNLPALGGPRNQLARRLEALKHRNIVA